MIKAVIFDLDDTLYSEKSFVVSGFRVVSDYLASKYLIDRQTIFRYLINSFQNGTRGRNFDALVEEFNLIGENIVALVDMYRTHKPDIRLYADAKVVVTHLRNERYKLGLLTDGYPLTQRNKIIALGLKDFFDVVIVTDELGKDFRKPSTKGYKLMLHQLNVKPKESVYVGDNPLKDFVGAKELGMPTIRVKRGDGIYDSVKVPREADADYTVSSLLQIVPIIKRLK